MTKRHDINSEYLINDTLDIAVANVYSKCKK